MLPGEQSINQMIYSDIPGNKDNDEISPRYEPDLQQMSHTTRQIIEDSRRA